MSSNILPFTFHHAFMQNETVIPPAPVIGTPPGTPPGTPKPVPPGTPKATIA